MPKWEVFISKDKAVKSKHSKKKSENLAFLHVLQSCPVRPDQSLQWRFWSRGLKFDHPGVYDCVSVLQTNCTFLGSIKLSESELKPLSITEMLQKGYTSMPCCLLSSQQLNTLTQLNNSPCCLTRVNIQTTLKESISLYKKRKKTLSVMILYLYYIQKMLNVPSKLAS